MLKLTFGNMTAELNVFRIDNQSMHSLENPTVLHMRLGPKTKAKSKSKNSNKCKKAQVEKLTEKVYVGIKPLPIPHEPPLEPSFSSNDEPIGSTIYIPPHYSDPITKSAHTPSYIDIQPWTQNAYEEYGAFIASFTKENISELTEDELK